MGTSFTNIAHATAVSGNDYYGNGADTCEPTDCVNGWHLKQGLNLTTAIGGKGGQTFAYVNGNGSFSENSGSYGQSFYGINAVNTYAVNYGNNGILIGQARCSTRPGSQEGELVSNLVDETGQTGSDYCYCNVTGYKASNNSSLQSVASSWGFNRSYKNVIDPTKYNCIKGCAEACAESLENPFLPALRNAVFGSVIPTLASCEANTITIHWDDASQTDIDANNAGTATYGSDVRTPVKAQTKKGKTFRGWRFSAPEQTNLP